MTAGTLPALLIWPMTGHWSELSLNPNSCPKLWPRVSVTGGMGGLWRERMMTSDQSFPLTCWPSPFTSHAVPWLGMWLLLLSYCEFVKLRSWVVEMKISFAFSHSSVLRAGPVLHRHCVFSSSWLFVITSIYRSDLGCGLKTLHISASKGCCNQIPWAEGLKQHSPILKA